MGAIHVFKDERDKPNIEILGQDRRDSNILYGRRIDDPKIKVIIKGITIPPPGKQYLSIRQGDEVYEQEAHSPVRNFYIRCINRIGSISSSLDANFQIRKQDNTLYTGNYVPQYSFATTTDIATTVTAGFCADNASETYGIALGDDDTAWDIDRYTIGNQIAHGSGAGQLLYTLTPTPIVSYAGGVWTIFGRRVFDNFSGGTITVKEAVQFVPEYTSTVQFIYLDEITILGTPKDILDKSGAVFTYTRTWAVPDITDLLPNGIAWLLTHIFGVSTYDAGSVYGSGHMCMKNTAGIVYASAYLLGRYNQTGHYHYDGVTGNINRGCVAGYSNTAVADGDYELGSLYAHGNLENQLAYAAQDTPVAVYNAGTKTFTITQSKTLTNNYGSSQVVREIGLKGWIYNSNTTQTPFLLSRTVLGSPVTLATGESLAIIYQPSLTHS